MENKKITRISGAYTFEHFGRTSKSVSYASYWLLLGSEKFCAYFEVNAESQCNCFRIGTEWLKRGSLVTTQARQFWKRCNPAISFSGMLWKSDLLLYTLHLILVRNTLSIITEEDVVLMYYLCTWPQFHGKRFPDPNTVYDNLLILFLHILLYIIWDY